ncbi:putative E3 ubiquitin-protein ligase WAVH2 [Carex rostrata]
MEITRKDVAPLEQNIQKVLLQLYGQENRRTALDLVAVLDVSSSMEGDKLQKMKMAMLSLIDVAHNCKYRLSIVEYSSKAKKLCPLRLMIESSKEKLQYLIHDLECQPGTNITDGLETALNVFRDRSSASSERVGVIILMSDGDQNQGGDAADFPVGNVPVLTFGFGEDHQEVLIAIANNSGLGGTYTEVGMDNLNYQYFPNCFDDLQRVVVWDLTVTVNQIKNESTVKCASAGRYLQSIDNATGSVTITLGTLYRKEPHYVLVDILLPVTENDHEADILKVSYTYRSSFDGERCEPRTGTVTVRRKSDLTAEEQHPSLEVTFTEAHLLIAEMIKKATGVADKEDLKSLRDKLLHNLEGSLTNIGCEMSRLKEEVENLSELMQSEAINENQGRSSTYSLLISHYKKRERYITVSPALREFLEEGMMYDDIDELLVYMDRFICALESIRMIILPFSGNFYGR